MSTTRSFEPFVARLSEFIRTCLNLSDSPEANAAREGLTFEALAQELFELQFSHNAPYRKICEYRKRTPEQVAGWREVPFVPTLAFKDLELTSLPPELRCQVFHSSGTTEQRPSRHFHSQESLAIYELSLRTWFAAHLDSPDTKLPFLSLTPPGSQAPHSSLVHMFETLLADWGAPGSSFAGTKDAEQTWRVDPTGVLNALSRASETGEPLWLFGTAFNYVHLLDALEDQHRRFQLPAGSKILETGGYKGRSRSLPKEELHQWMVDRLGVRPGDILCEYGMSELSSQAYDWPNDASTNRSREFRFPPWARCRVISPETGLEVGTGEVGLLQIVDLANVFSVMAIQTEDLVRRGDLGFQWIGRASDAESRGCSLMSTAS